MTTVSFPRVAAHVRGCADAQALIDKVIAEELRQYEFEAELQRAFAAESGSYKSGFCRALQKALERSPTR